MSSSGRWEAAIAPQSIPADGKVTFFAKDRSGYQIGISTLTLRDDLNPEVTIRLGSAPSVQVRGVVVDGQGNSVEGARVSVVGYSDLVITDSMGNFALPAHAADGQPINLRAEKGRLNIERLVLAGGSVELVLR